MAGHNGAEGPRGLQGPVAGLFLSFAYMARPFVFRCGEFEFLMEGELHAVWAAGFSLPSSDSNYGSFGGLGN